MSCLSGPHLRYPGQQAKDKFIFVGEDGLMLPDDRDLLRYEFRPVLKRLKLYYPGFGWHAFRRQNITWRQQLGGATPLEAQKAAGHGSLDMTRTYAPWLTLTGRRHRYRRCLTSSWESEKGSRNDRAGKEVVRIRFASTAQSGA